MNALAQQLLTVCKRYLGPAAAPFLHGELRAIGLEDTLRLTGAVVALGALFVIALGKLSPLARAFALVPNLAAAGLLAGDHAHLAESARAVADSGARWLHCDIMDGHFVPNLTFGPETLAALRRAGSKLFFDTHLMLAEPQKYIEAFAQAGANHLSIHIEPAYDHRGTLVCRQAAGNAGSTAC